MKAEELFEKRILDLANQAYTQGRYTFTSFLDLYEQSLFLSAARQIKGIGWEFFGGYEGAERRMIRFGSPEELGYEQEYPLILFHMTLQGGRFS